MRVWRKSCTCSMQNRVWNARRRALAIERDAQDLFYLIIGFSLFHPQTDGSRRCSWLYLLKHFFPNIVHSLICCHLYFLWKCISCGRYVLKETIFLGKKFLPSRIYNVVLNCSMFKGQDYTQENLLCILLRNYISCKAR